MRSRLAKMATGAALGAVLAVASGALAAPADSGPAPTPLTLATTTSDGPIAVYRGWIVWSAPGSGGWHLTGWHNGAVAELPVAPRQEPFDVDLGTDARGHVVATYSRGRRTPSLAFFGYLDASTGSDCRVRALFLTTGREQVVALPHPR